MTLADIAVRRPVLAIVISLLISAFGVLGFLRLPLREYPNVDSPIVSVQTTYRGAAAAVIENRITQVIEDRLSGIAGIKAITSNSKDGRSEINVEFSADRPIDDAANDVRDRVSSVVANLPQEADPPQINKVEADAAPIIFVALRGKGKTILELSDYADRYVTDRLSSLNGVANVQIFGGARIAMRIWLDRQRLAALSLTANDVEAALRAQNVELPAGRIESNKVNMTVRVNRPYATPSQFEQLILKRGTNGYLVRLGDVAHVEIGPDNPYTSFRSDGIPTVAVAIVRQSNANTLEVAREVRHQVEALQKTVPPGIDIFVNFDTSLFIEAAIKSVYRTLAEAAVLVVAVIFLFLGSLRATLMPAVSVPVSLLGAILTLWALGYSLNLLTLLALVLAIGLVVDDAIVVLENIYHRIEKGEGPLVAAYRGTKEVGFAVVASTVVVIAVFVPVLFIGGDKGKLFVELAAAMIGALAFSLLVSLTLTPAMCSKILSAKHKPGRITRLVDTGFQHMANAYQRLLHANLRAPWLVIIIVVAALALITGIGRGLKSELAPDEDQGIFFVTAQLPESSGFNYAFNSMLKVEKKLLAFAANEPAIRRVIVRAPGNNSAVDQFNTGAATIIMQPWDKRRITTKEMTQKVQKLLADIPEVRIFAAQRSSLGGSRNRPIQFVIAGSLFSDLAVARDGILKAAEKERGIQGLDADYKETKPQILIDVDTARAADLGLSQTTIGHTLETMMGSLRATTFIDRGKEYDVLLQAQVRNRLSPTDLENTYVRSETTGALIPLSNVVHMQEMADAGTLGRYNKLRAITFNGSLAPGYTLGQALAFLETEAAKYPAQIAATGYLGDSRDFKETGSSLYFVGGMALLVVMLVLAAQFESFVHPFTIILTVPLAIAGAVLGLWVTQGTLNIYTQVGIIMLVGLATKNGILIVEFANQLRDAGLSIREAVTEAASRRLRPIVMTSIATVAGAVPLMLSHGAGASARHAIGTVIVYGVAIATSFTLFVIPVVYTRLARFTGSPDAVSRKLDEQMQRLSTATPSIALHNQDRLAAE